MRRSSTKVLIPCPKSYDFCPIQPLGLRRDNACQPLSCTGVRTERGRSCANWRFRRRAGAQSGVSADSLQFRTRHRTVVPSAGRDRSYASLPSVVGSVGQGNWQHAVCSTERSCRTSFGQDLKTHDAFHTSCNTSSRNTGFPACPVPADSLLPPPDHRYRVRHSGCARKLPSQRLQFPAALLHNAIPLLAWHAQELAGPLGVACDQNLGFFARGDSSDHDSSAVSVSLASRRYRCSADRNRSEVQACPDQEQFAVSGPGYSGFMTPDRALKTRAILQSSSAARLRRRRWQRRWRD